MMTIYVFTTALNVWDYLAFKRVKNYGCLSLYNNTDQDKINEFNTLVLIDLGIRWKRKSWKMLQNCATL